MEVLRLVSMFMVLALHADYAALGIPSAADAVFTPVAVTGRVFCEQAAIVAVNVFVLISGWFGMRAGVRGVCSLLWQVVYCAAVVIAVMLCVEGTSLLCTRSWLTFLPGYYHWFIRSYLGLLILSPVLNAYIKHTTVRVQAIVVLFFYIFQSLYGWWIGADGFNSGYSLQSFIGLYLLGALARRCRWQRFGPWRWGALYLFTVLGSTACGIYMLSQGYLLSPRLTAYDSPLVVAGALGLLLTFASISPTWSNRVVNATATSALAVYLLHCNPLIFKYYMAWCRDIYTSTSSLGCISLMTLLLLVVFLVSIIVDRPRLWLWRRLQPVAATLESFFIKVH